MSCMTISNGPIVGGAPRRDREGPDHPFRPGLLAELLDDQGLVRIDAASDRLGMTRGDLAEVVGLSAETLRRRSRARSRNTQAKLAALLEIVGRVSDWAGGERQALAWYRAAPLPAFGGRTAEALVKEGKAGAVRDYLDHVALGGFA